MESEDHVGLSDIIDVLNTLDNQLSPQQNDDLTLGDPSPFIDERQPPQQSPPRPQQSGTKQKPKTHPEPSPHPVATPHRVSSPGTSAGTSNGKKHKPYIKILEQPAGKTVRFRYKCEGRSAGSIPGVNSTSEIKTYPSIEIVGYKGEVVIVVSCVTKDPPYRPHPHNLVGKEGCKNGICTLVLNGEPLRAVFSNLGIQCVKKNDVKKALDEREDLKVDPFKTKFAHKDQPSSIDLNSVRLCFQAFLKTPDGVKILTPVVTDPIYDKKSISDLTISRLCSCSAKVGGGDEIIMLCEKVTKDDIKIRFYELSADGRLLWEDFAEFQQTDIHKQTAIAFKTPRYRSTDVTEKAKVFIQLMRPSDGATSEPLPFEYYPDTGMRSFSQLRRKIKRKQDLEIFQQVLSLDSVTTATKYSDPASEQLDGGSDDVSKSYCSIDELNRSNPLSSDTLNDCKEAMRQLNQSGDGICGAVEANGSLEHVNDMETEAEVPIPEDGVIHPSSADKTTQTSTPGTEPTFEDAQSISTSNKITEWMRASDFKRTESLIVENGGGSYSNATASSLNAASCAGLDEDYSDLPEEVVKLDEAVTKPTLEDAPMTETLVTDGCVFHETKVSTVVPHGHSASNQTSVDIDEKFDDTTTYNSLQIAFKNPIDIPVPVLNYPEPATSPTPSIILTTSNETSLEAESSDLVVLTNPPAPKIQINSAQTPLSAAAPSPCHNNMLPSVPLKQTRPPPDIALSTEHCSSDPRSIQGTATSHKQHNGSPDRAHSSAPIIIMRTPDPSPTKRHPNTSPTASSSKKKQGFLSRLFTRRKSKPDNNTKIKNPNSKTTSAASSREPSIGNFSLLDANRGGSTRSIKSNTSGLSPQNGSQNGSPSERSAQRVARSSSSTSDHFKRKRIKTAGSPMNILRRELQKHEQLQSSKLQNDFPDASSTGVNFWNAPFSPPIKPEPAMSPLNFGPYRSPYQLASPSPQPPSPNNRLDTPSPGLVKALSAGSQSQMCDMFAYNAGLRDQKSPSAGTAYQQQEPLHQKPRQNSISTNPFSADLNIINNNNNISNCDFNNLVPLSTQQSPSGGMNIFIDHHTIAPSTSGGSITPIWSAEASQNTTIEAQQINIGMTQQQQLQQQQQLLQNQQLLQQVQQKQILQQQQLLQQQQHQHQQQQQQLPQQYQHLQLQQEQQQQQYQQQFQQQQQIQHDLEMLVNAATTEECPTLSGLLAYVDSEQLMNINSEDLPLSNLSIST